MTVDPKSLPYRQCVGLCLFNAQGKVLIAERSDRPGSWQMPQGGVQKGEDLQVAALRELKEELGTDNAEIISRLPVRLSYDFPDWLQWRGGIFRGKYRGQEQDWFALRFKGTDADIDLSNEHEPEKPEFRAWRWAELEEAPRLIVEFKRDTYEKVVEGFKPVAEALRNNSPLPVMTSHTGP